MLDLMLEWIGRTLPYKSVIVKINDRGPFVEGRIIDLTRSAFNSIGDTEAGLIDVRIEVVE